MGWSSLANGALLAKAAGAGFAVMITKDTGVEYEQYLTNLPLAVIVLRAKTNKLEDIRPLLPELLTALVDLVPKSLVNVG
ncbi:MAG: hypothetical protein H7144_16270 [Burkholderiales bacterium]|nr:hypothetical protein [Phycisphaerae bacterium]